MDKRLPNSNKTRKKYSQASTQPAGICDVKCSHLSLHDAATIRAATHIPAEPYILPGSFAWWTCRVLCGHTSPRQRTLGSQTDDLLLHVALLYSNPRGARLCLAPFRLFCQYPVCVRQIGEKCAIVSS